MLLRPLTKFEIQNFYQNETKFNGANSRNNIPKIKHEAAVINLQEYESIWTHWIALHVNGNNIISLIIQIYFLLKTMRRMIK